MRISRAARETCGAIFDASRPSDELTKIEQRVAEPDFWKDQEAAQKLLQRRRRLEDDLNLSESLKRRVDDLTVLMEWAEAGSRSWTISRAASTNSPPRSIRARRRRCSAASTTARTPSSRSIPARVAPNPRTGPRCCCACTCGGSSATSTNAR